MSYLVRFAGTDVAVVFDGEQLLEWHFVSAVLTAVSKALQSIHLEEALKSPDELPRTFLLYAGN